MSLFSLRRALVLAAVAMLLAGFSAANAQRLTAVGWNVESGGAIPSRIAKRIRSFQGVDIWGLSEVRNESWAGAFEVAAEDGESGNFRHITGTTGRDDRLVILYNAERFLRVSHQQLHHINPEGRVRAPLVAHFRERATGREFLFMVNHLYRGDNAARHRQATQLNTWARQQTLPVIAVGDYNFDWSVSNGDTNHDRGYDNMTRNGVFNWVRPATLVRSQCDPTFNSVLDFVFTTPGPNGFRGTSEIVVESGDCPDDGNTPDHRPLRATLTAGGN
ncbi:MAG TPA: endonuclease/exonuclease/phosphatase family protein [Pyrinomonadaceae bacterium]